MHVTYISQRDRDISQVAASLGAFDGSRREALIEFLCRSGQCRMKWLRRAAFSKSRITFGCKSVLRTDHLADVASEYPGPDIVAQFKGNSIFQLDG